MSAGLPGVGLSGVFFIVSALLMVPREIVRTIRGRSSLERWRTVLRHLSIAMAMIVGLELAYAVMHLALEHLVGGTSSHRVRLVPFAPVLATLALISCLVLGAKLIQVISQRRATRAARRESEPRDRPRVFAGSGTPDELAPSPAPVIVIAASTLVMAMIGWRYARLAARSG